MIRHINTSFSETDNCQSYLSSKICKSEFRK